VITNSPTDGKVQNFIAPGEAWKRRKKAKVT
jgi:hypothetical protein